MINSKLKQILAVALVAQGVFMTSKALMKSFEVSGKLAKEKNLRTPASEEDYEKIMTTKTHEINHVYQQIKPLFSKGNLHLDEEMLLNLNRVPVVSFETESEDWMEASIDVNYPEKIEKRAFWKVIFRCPTEQHTDIVLRLCMEDWKGYVDILLYRCVSKVMTNENYLQVVHTNDILIDGLTDDDFIILERVNRKIEGRGNVFFIKNKVSGTGFVSKNYHNSF